MRVYVDFDGTVSRQDTTDLLLERFADPEWLDIEASWLRGEIGSRDCMARQISLLRATPDELAACLAEVEIDEAFPRFVHMCRDRRVNVTILSDGLDVVVKTVLRRAGLALPIIANQLSQTEEGGWTLTFPYMRRDCGAVAGNCKCYSLKAGWRGGVAAITYAEDSVLIGDGRSDFCGAGLADAVFAKGKLAEHCRATGVHHISFDGFADLIPRFETWLTGSLARYGVPPRRPDASRQTAG